MDGEIPTRGNGVQQLLQYEPFFQNNVILLQKAKTGFSPETAFDFVLTSEVPGELVEAVPNISIKSFENYRKKKATLT